MLRANLRYFNVDRDNRSIVVTSAASGEGKSTVAWNLAAAAAEAGARVLLIEADLRRPSLAERHGLSAGQGLSGVLAGQTDLDRAALTIPLGEHTPTGGHTSFDVLLAGPIPPNPSDLIESNQLAKLIDSAQQRYDMMVIDTPPATIVSDTAPLIKQVSGLIVVSRLGQTTRDSAGHLQRHLQHLGAPTLGVVVNGVSTRDRYYGGYENARGGYAEEASSLETRSDRVSDASRAREDRPEVSRPAAVGAAAPASQADSAGVSTAAPATTTQASPAGVSAEAPATRARQLVAGPAAAVDADGHRPGDSITNGRPAAAPPGRGGLGKRLRRLLRG